MIIKHTKKLKKLLSWVIAGRENSNFCHRNSLFSADFFHFTSCGSKDNSTRLRLPSYTTDSEKFRKSVKNIRKLSSHQNQERNLDLVSPFSRWNWIIQLFNSVVTVQKFIIITNIELIMWHDSKMAWRCEKWKKKPKKYFREVHSSKIQIIQKKYIA